MGFRIDTYCKIWTVEDKGNYSVANISVSRKNKDTGEYEIEFQDGYVRLVGTAHNVCKNLDIPKNGVSAKITSCDVTNKYDAKTKKTYTNYVIFGLELSDSNNKNSNKTTAKAKKNTKPVVEEDDDDGELPF